MLIPESHVLLELIADLFPHTLYPDTAVGRAEARYFIGESGPGLSFVCLYR